MNTLPPLVATREPARIARAPRRWPWIGMALLLAGGLALAACVVTNPRQVGFQGRLNDSAGNPVTGPKTMIFSLWTEVNGGTRVFSETQQVQVTNGLFNVFIGSGTSDANGEYGRAGVDPEKFAIPLYVQVQVDGETLLPRTLLGAAPSSMGLVGGAVVISDHEGNGAGGEDTTNGEYGTLSVVASSDVAGTALVIGHVVGNTGDYIRAYGDVSTTTTVRNFADLEFRVDDGGQVYADGAYHCGNSITDGVGTLDETEIGPCLVDDSPADFAEYLPASANLQAGDVLAVDANGALVRSNQANQTNVVGVYSSRPSYVGNGRFADDSRYAPLAISGIVPVKVTGAVKAGDMLVASNVPGHAMRGGSNPAAGTVIGKALQASKTSYGVILMLVMTR